MKRANPPARARRAATVSGVLARSLLLVTLIPFVPMGVLTLATYRAEVRRVETDILAANRQIATLAANHLDGLMREVRRTEELLQAAAAPELPLAIPGVRWEAVDADGAILGSQLPSPRERASDEYGEFLARVSRDGSLSGVGRFVEEWPPTVLAARGMASGGWFLVAVLDPEQLHRELAALSSAPPARHVYAVAGDGALLFYSDLALSRRGADLRANPPIRMFLEGRTGDIRYRSLVSGRERLGVVRALKEAPWGIIASADAGAGLLTLRTRYAALALSIVFAATAALAIFAWASRRVTVPLLTVRDAMRQRSSPNPGPLQLPEGRTDLQELDELVRAFDELQARVAAAENDLLQAEKVALLGQLASGIAHELGTPLNVIRARAELAIDRLGEHPEVRGQQIVLEQVDHVSRLISHLLDYVRIAPPVTEPIPPARALTTVAELLAVEAERRGVAIATEAAPDLPPLRADPGQLQQVLVNLAINALDACERGGRVTVRARAAPAAPPGAPAVLLEVEDDGAGIEPAVRTQVFDPFYTTKKRGHGTGLGLWVVAQLVRAHEGEIDLDSRPGAGTLVRVTWPAAA